MEFSSFCACSVVFLRSQRTISIDTALFRRYTIYEVPTAAVSDVAPWSLILVDCVASREVTVDSASGVALGSMAVGEPWCFIGSSPTSRYGRKGIGLYRFRGGYAPDLYTAMPGTALEAVPGCFCSAVLLDLACCLPAGDSLSWVAGLPCPLRTPGPARVFQLSTMYHRATHPPRG